MKIYGIKELRLKNEYEKLSILMSNFKIWWFSPWFCPLFFTKSLKYQFPFFPNILQPFRFMTFEYIDTLGQSLYKDSILLVLLFKEFIFLSIVEYFLFILCLFGFKLSFETLKFSIKLFHSMSVLSPYFLRVQ